MKTSREYADRILDHIEREADLSGKTLYLALDTSFPTPIDAEILKAVSLRAFCALRVTRIVAMAFDTRIIGTVEINNTSQVDRLQALQVYGGGTDPACVLEAVAQHPDSNPGLWRRVFIITDGIFMTKNLSAQMTLGVQPILLITPGGARHSDHRGTNCYDL